MAVVDKNVDKHGTRAVGRGVPRVPLHARRARRSPPSTTTARATRRSLSATPRKFPKLELFTVDERVRRLAEGADDALRRRRHRSTRSTSRDMSAAAVPAERVSRRPAAAPRATAACCPGSGCRWAYTLTYLSLLVLIPLAGLVLKSAALGWREFWQAVVGAARAGGVPAHASARRWRRGLVNGVFGLVLAWVLARYRLPGQGAARRAGRPAVRAADRGRRHRADRAVRRERLARAASSSRSGSRSRSRRAGVVVAMIFVGLPFVVRTVQPVLMDIDPQHGGGGGDAGRVAPADVAARDPARGHAGAADRLRAGVRARPRRVRIDRLHLGQHADAAPRSCRC